MVALNSHQSCPQETDGLGFLALNPTQWHHPARHWEANTCHNSCAHTYHTPKEGGTWMSPLERSSAGAGSGKGSSSPMHRPSCLRPATHFLQAFLTTGSGVPAFTDFPEGTQTSKVTWELPLPVQGFCPETPHTHSCPNVSELKLSHEAFGFSRWTPSCPGSSPTPRTGSGPRLPCATLLLPPCPAPPAAPASTLSRA